MRIADMVPSTENVLVYVTDDGCIDSRDMTRDQLLFIIEDLLQERDSLRNERKSLTQQIFDSLRRRK